jgi:hypothetical protein
MKTIRTYEWTNKEREEFLDECNDLLIVIHQDDSLGELAKATKRFTDTNYRKALPRISEIDDFLCHDHEELNEIHIIIKLSDE